MTKRPHPTPSDNALAVALHKRTGRRVIVRGRAGRQKTDLPSAILVSMFANAIGGDMKVAAELLALAKEHLEAKPKKPSDKQRCTNDVTQYSVDKWAALGLVPEGCPKVISEISTRQLNRIYKSYKAFVSEKNSTPKGVEEFKKLGKNLLGDEDAIIVDECNHFARTLHGRSPNYGPH